MRRLGVGLYMTLLAVFVCGCGRTTYVFMHDISFVNSVKIVETTDYIEGTFEFGQDLLCEIENIDEFIEDFSHLNCFNHVGDPNQLDIGDIAIRIDYDNGDYELISCYEQQKCGPDGYSDGFFEFEQEEFEALLFRYLGSRDREA